MYKNKKNKKLFNICVVLLFLGFEDGDG